MTNDALKGSNDSRFVRWIVATFVLFLAAAAVGFVWLPSAQLDAGAPNLWAAICRAIGVPNRGPPQAGSIAGQPSSKVAWTVETRQLLRRGDAAHGASLAINCINCHGAKGVSTDAAFPNLVGQSVAAIYKQLEDFRTRKRDAAVMGVWVDSLSQQDVLDIATYFASQPNPFARAGATAVFADPVAHRLIEVGDPGRGIASCSACHGPLGFVPGAPGLRGQQRAYLEQQMQAFNAGLRRNDISEQMRSVARQLTAGEIAGLAAFYSSFPL